MRVLFVINSLGAGGAERVLSHVLAAAPKDLAGIDVALLDVEPHLRALPEGIPRHELDCRGRLDVSTHRLIKLARRLKPDLIVSFLVRANIAAIIAGRVLGVPCVTSERMHLRTHLREKHGALKAHIFGLLPRAFYPFADRVIAVSQGVADDLTQHWGVREPRIVVTPNPLDIARMCSDAQAAPEFALPDRFVLAVGRMVESKGYLELFDAYQQSGVVEPLVVLGDGLQRSVLEADRARRGLEGRILMPGYASNPFAIMARAMLYVSASHCEGFPNAMAEAMALGTPVAVTDCPSGPAEILELREGAARERVIETPFGMLTPIRSSSALAQAMRMMMEDERRTSCARAARARAEAFSAERVAQNYWSTFAQAIVRD